MCFDRLLRVQHTHTHTHIRTGDFYPRRTSAPLVGLLVAADRHKTRSWICLAKFKIQSSFPLSAAAFVRRTPFFVRLGFYEAPVVNVCGANMVLILMSRSHMQQLEMSRPSRRLQRRHCVSFALPEARKSLEPSEDARLYKMYLLQSQDFLSAVDFLSFLICI